MNIDMENRSFFLLKAFIILTPFAILYGLIFRKWKYRNHCLFFECILVLICLTIACFQDSKPHYLLGMTKFQEIILFCVGLSYIVDGTDIILSYKETDNPIDLKNLTFHHIPGYIGILYMLYSHQCGGIITRLLFDCVDYTLQLLDYVTEQKYEELLDDLQEIAFFKLVLISFKMFLLFSIVFKISFGFSCAV